ncbi:MAG: L7Ae/L30e/S12e/Gadd45 family ribosomal protein [Ruminococcus sp.]
MNDRLLSLLGIARKAGKLIIGNDPVREAIEANKACIVLLADDISENTAKKIITHAESFSVECYVMKRSKEELSLSLGKTCAVIAVIDRGFSDKLKELIETELKGGNSI